MLSGASLAPRFWPYAFYHILRLHNMTIHGDQVKTPHELCSSRKPDLSRLRTFGCRLDVEPPRPRRPANSYWIEARTSFFSWLSSSTSILTTLSPPNTLATMKS
jgi:hypothetical protein